MNGYGLEKKRTGPLGKRRQLLVLAVVLGVFCVFLFVIRFVNAKSNVKKIMLNKKVSP